MGNSPVGCWSGGRTLSFVKGGGLRRNSSKELAHLALHGQVNGQVARSCAHLQLPVARLFMFAAIVALARFSAHCGWNVFGLEILIPKKRNIWEGRTAGLKRRTRNKVGPELIALSILRRRYTKMPSKTPKVGQNYSISIHWTKQANVQPSLDTSITTEFLSAMVTMTPTRAGITPSCLSASSEPSGRHSHMPRGCRVWNTE
jgi:hypothetical protein